MLVGLHVKNLALIEQADVEFGNGLNILTGETGAGKSIIIGSVALALGAKASRDMIRCGEEYAYIELIFSVDDEKKREELKKMDVYPDEDGLLIISKKITQTRSISRINDETVTTARLKAVTGKLLDIHGQHEHQSLLHKQKHLEILDEYSWRETGSLKRNVAESYRRYLELKGKLDGFSLDEESRKRELDFVRFEIDEIEDSALKPGEEEELAAKFRKFSHSQKIMESLQGAYQAVDGDAIGRAYREMESVASYDERLSGIAAGLSDAESILSDICRSISDYMDEMEFSGEDFKKTEERLDLVRGIMAKYGNSEEAVLKSLEEKKKRLEDLENYEELAFAAKAEFEEQKRVLGLLCGRLSKEREKAAKILENRITEELEDLNFLHVEFRVDDVPSHSAGLWPPLGRMGAGMQPQLPTLHQPGNAAGRWSGRPVAEPSAAVSGTGRMQRPDHQRWRAARPAGSRAGPHGVVRRPLYGRHPDLHGLPAAAASLAGRPAGGGKSSRCGRRSLPGEIEPGRGPVRIGKSTLGGPAVPGALSGFCHAGKDPAAVLGG